jgi:hypothetical protein
MLKYFALIGLTCSVSLSIAQTNVFPANGNVGIGTLNPRAGLDMAKYIPAGALGTVFGRLAEGDTQGNGTFLGVQGFETSISGYNGKSFSIVHNFYGQTNSSINFYRGGSIEGGFITFNTYSNIERLRIDNNGNVGIGTIDPKARLDLVGGIMMQSNLNNQSVRPPVSSNKIPGEIRVYSSWGATADDGLLRLSAGGGTNPGVMSYIDISSYSTVPDMDKNIVFGTNGSEKMRISTSGNVGIGMNSPAEKLSVNGNIRAKEIKVETQNWPDYVFKSDYSLPSLEATEKHIKEKGHLPGIPSAAEAETQGINLSEMNGKLLKKIEELTLHLIEKEKLVNDLLKRVEKLEQRK